MKNFMLITFMIWNSFSVSAEAGGRVKAKVNSKKVVRALTIGALSAVTSALLVDQIVKRKSGYTNKTNRIINAGISIVIMGGAGAAYGWKTSNVTDENIMMELRKQELEDAIYEMNKNGGTNETW